MIKILKVFLKSGSSYFYHIWGFTKHFNNIEVPSFSARISPYAEIKKGVYSLGSSLIGRNVSIGMGTYINSGIINNAIIGEFCSVAYDVKIGMTEHVIDGPSTSPVYMRNEFGDAKLADKDNSYCLIGNHTWIGANAVILQGVKIGSHCVIGAGSIVTRDIPDNEVWAGSPAIYIRRKKSDD
ncbi:DapH/DapD/GlmU-related protein [Vibrio alginolyticus]